MRQKAADAEIGQQKCWKEKIMNKVFVSGIIAGEPALHSSENGMAHLIFPLSVRHRTMNGMMRQEIYTINAWNNPAIWGKENLRVGNLITVQGYLTQHSRENGVLMTEVTAEEFLLGLKPGRRFKEKAAPAVLDPKEDAAPEGEGA